MSKYVVSNVPTINRSRSRFDLSHGHKTSATLGYLYPLDPIEVLPGDTFKFNMSMVCRLASTLVKPIMDNIFMDIHYFFVPKRILFDKFEEMYTKAAPSDWVEPEDVELPLLGDDGDGEYNGNQDLNPTQNGYQAQVACHFGFPVGQDVLDYWVDDDEQSHLVAPVVLPFRAFAMVYNEFFRDQNLIDPMNIVKGATGQYEYLNTNAWSPTNYTGNVPKVSKLHDLFTSVLPSPQKGIAPTIPLSLIDDIPVVTGDNHDVDALAPGLHSDSAPFTALGAGDYQTFVRLNSEQATLRYDEHNPYYSPATPSYPFVPNNLWATAGDYQSSITVNDLRFAFQYQKLLEQQARQGSRFVEWLYGTWQVQPGDSRLQRPEYLGGKRIPLNINQVTQMTGYSDSQASQTLGQLGGQSQTADKYACRWSKSFTEPGYLIGVFCLRQFHSYQQGMSKMWYKKKRIDFYEPQFANIGEQPIYKYQLYCSTENLGTSDGNGNPKIFGYQEAWQEYRQIPNLITGQMLSDTDDSLDVWHLGDTYAKSPSLGQSWIEETSDNLDRCLTVESTVQDQFIIDFWEGIQAIRCMPVYSVPGLIDHH